MRDRLIHRRGWLSQLSVRSPDRQSIHRLGEAIDQEVVASSNRNKNAGRVLITRNVTPMLGNLYIPATTMYGGNKLLVKVPFKGRIRGWFQQLLSVRRTGLHVYDPHVQKEQ
ncbi:uncharacterized protein MCYG_07138 [Microsporum canis CBS 113480]|uniref:Uncharacterized protein n=1 Tax=Arthroderma otae (strain ATCC MYA-4605 / CBS 113480) TaxID=554155 RepID=C5FWN5_ARTOC|nr:uncharacterized protein MCYG_07138 [Microsporum canis CBS 113480]EEQ34319.1 predicted protein [Microsporum canis CBS 113480]